MTHVTSIYGIADASYEFDLLTGPKVAVSFSPALEIDYHLVGSFYVGIRYGHSIRTSTDTADSNSKSYLWRHSFAPSVWRFRWTDENDDINSLALAVSMTFTNDTKCVTTHAGDTCLDARVDFSYTHSVKFPWLQIGFNAYTGELGALAALGAQHGINMHTRLMGIRGLISFEMGTPAKR